MILVQTMFEHPLEKKHRKQFYTATKLRVQQLGFLWTVHAIKLFYNLSKFEANLTMHPTASLN